MLLRADSDCSVHYWSLGRDNPVGSAATSLRSSHSMSLEELWSRTRPLGLLDQVVSFLPHFACLAYRPSVAWPGLT